jgi:peptidoglycan/xylan/chitin deacetylase (PgdA/CDA1 family)
MNELFSANTPDAFWRPLAPIPAAVWDAAAADAADMLPATLAEAARSGIGAAGRVIPAALSESLFGPDRYRLSGLKSAYYAYARPLLPTWVRPLLRKVYHPAEEVQSLLHWPVEDRFVRFQFAQMAAAMKRLGRETQEIVGLWPEGKQFAFVLTHDVEARGGHDFVREVMALEEKYGFRSSFNFVPEGYRVDRELRLEIKARGFEVGVHGLKHDGRLFSSRELFEQRARRINGYAADWGAVGYRSPMTHRNPEWMQSLDIQYDLSFFDTDPYEPMAGGSMSIWPFTIGRFVELPYTLMQDHRYLEVLEQRTPQLWLDKVDFLAAHHGMALLNSHPDYLMKGDGMAVYEGLLAALRQRGDCWSATPREVADWWRRRAEGAMPPGATVWTARRAGDGLRLDVAEVAPAAPLRTPL